MLFFFRERGKQSSIYASRQINWLMLSSVLLQLTRFACVPPHPAPAQAWCTVPCRNLLGKLHSPTPYTLLMNFGKRSCSPKGLSQIRRGWVKTHIMPSERWHGTLNLLPVAICKKLTSISATGSRIQGLCGISNHDIYIVTALVFSTQET